MTFSSVEKRRAWVRKRYAQRRRSAIYLLGGKCARCGSENDLEIDHINPADKTCRFAYATMLKWDTFIAHIEKCQVLYSSCHLEKSKKDISKAMTGENNGHAKLSANDVLEIRDRYANDAVSARKLAKEYQVSHTTILYIAQRKRWKHI